MPLDTSARIGLGGTALFTLAGLGVPLFGWEILGPIMAVCALVAMWGFWPLLRDRLPVIFKYLRGAGMRHAMLAGMLILGLGIGDLIGTNNFVFWDKYPGTGPIVWNFEDAARGRGYFLDLQKQPDRGVVVAGFGAHGKNITSEPVMDFDGYLRSDRNNERLPVYILAANATIANACTPLLPTLPQDTLGIPAFADFNVSTSKKPIVINRFEGLTLSEFENEFVPFTIVMTYGGNKYQRHFTKEEVDRQIAMLEKLAAPSLNPYVIRKSTAPPVTIALPPLSPLISPNATPVPETTEKVPEK